MRSSAVVEERIEPERLLRAVGADGCGASVLFLGTVRDSSEGRSVTAMEYSAYRPMAERELAAILAEIHASDAELRMVVEHRIGALELGDVSVAIAVAHPHRGPAYEASRRIIEEIKRRVPIWKREHFTDGTTGWVGAASSTVEDADA